MIRRRFILTCAVMLVLGLVGLIVGVFLDRPRFFFSYLTGWAFFVSTAIGALMLVMIGHASRARWFSSLRRLGEYVAATIPLFALLAVPILLGLETLYGWAGPLDRYSEHERHLIEHKAAWLNAPFFTARTFFYLIVLGVFSHLLISASLRADEGPDEVRTRYLQRLGSGGIPVAAFILTWASFDWLMSLDPTWWSTIFGVYFWAGGFVAALSLLSILAASFNRWGLIPSEVGAYHQWATGRLMFGFVIFWAYQGFAQLLVIWIANMPTEITFYLQRSNEGWRGVSFFLGVGQFVIPFAILLSRDLKRRPAVLAAIGGWLLFAHYVDIYWMVMPNHTPHGVVVHWLDLCALLAIGGSLGLFVAFRFRNRSTVPLHDPYYFQSLQYRGPA